jgi:putative methionine-R-sulfoxide reductase with GAF domain
LPVDDQRLGVLHVASKTVDAFSDQDLHFLEAKPRRRQDGALLRS